MKTKTMLNVCLVALVLAWARPMWAQGDPPTDWPTNWAWTAPDWPPGEAPYWYDYGWDSTSNGPVPAVVGEVAARRAADRAHGRGSGAPLRMTRHEEDALPVAPEGPAKQTGFYADTFLSLKTEDFAHGEWGYGVGVGYQVSPHWGADVRLSHEGFDAAGSVIQDAGVRLVARMPFQTWNPYTFLGSRYDFERDQWRIEPGAGVAIGTMVQWFAEGSLDADLHGRNGYKLASGVRFRF